MTVSERRKGLRGQQEVQRIMRAAGLELRKLGGEGDALVTTANGVTLHVETKRQERLQLPSWLRQAATEAPKGTVPVVAFRQSALPRRLTAARASRPIDERGPLERGEWYACLPLADLVELIGG